MCLIHVRTKKDASGDIRRERKTVEEDEDERKTEVEMKEEWGSGPSRESPLIAA